VEIGRNGPRISGVKLFRIVGGRFYIPKKYMLIELRMQGGYPQKLEFIEIA
jgi:hypothetical protein